MAKHGLTRVQFRGERAVVVAGAVPAQVAIQGFDKELVLDEPVKTPYARARPTRPPTRPATVPTFAKTVEPKPQAESVEPTKKES